MMAVADLVFASSLGGRRSGEAQCPRPSVVCFSANPSSTSPPLTVSSETQRPVVVVGSANADIYLEVDRLPLPGETVSARAGFNFAGGKGANQACCAARLAHPTHFVGQIGSDAHGTMIEDALRGSGVDLRGLARLDPGVPSGHAVVMLQPSGQNSIIVVGGANADGWPDQLRADDLVLIEKAGIVLLQREIPDRINSLVAQAAKSANVPVILDVGGMEGAIPMEILSNVDILSPNETELGRLTGLPTESFEQVSQAVAKCHDMGVKQVLVKLGGKGSALFIEGEEPIRQPIIPAACVVDTTGAGDSFTAAFAVALVEGRSLQKSLEFAAAAASLCIQMKGAIPSMPDKSTVLKLLRSF